MVAAILSPTRKADRAAMAAILSALVEEKGHTANVMLQWPGPDWPPETMVEVLAGPARLGLTFGKLEATNGYVMPWCIQSDREARFAAAFGAAVRAEVNPHHRRKCMTCEPTWKTAVASIARALDCINRGEAFE